MDGTDGLPRTISINMSMKKSADVTIDLRQNSLIHLFTINNVESLIESSTSNDEKRCPQNTNSTKYSGEESAGCVDGLKGNDDDSSTIFATPSTIIHLKVVSSGLSNGNKLCEKSIHLSNSLCDEKSITFSKVPDKSNDAVNLSRNSLKIRTSLYEMQREKQNIEKNEQSIILKEFEITKQIERLRSENKKISRRKYHNYYERPTTHIRIHSPKSEFSDKSSNDISSIFHDSGDTSSSSADECNGFEAEFAQSVKNEEKSHVNKNKSEFVASPASIKSRMSNVEGHSLGAPQEVIKSNTSKRKKDSICGPQSKKCKLMSGCKTISNRQTISSNRKQVKFICQSHQHYHGGRQVFKDFGGPSLKEEVSLFIGIDQNEDDDFSQVGNEILNLWKLNEEEIGELKSQVREEFNHKQNEHIMPLILNMSPDQIELTYEEVKDVMKMYDITEQDSDEGSPSSNEEDEEEGKCGEFKSLDALYKEEFSKKCYIDLFGPPEKDSDTLSWKDGEEQNEKQTDYSRSRPKRSCVDYSPSAYAFIGFMEGRRSNHKHNLEDHRSPNKVHKVRSSSEALLNTIKKSNGNKTNSHANYSDESLDSVEMSSGCSDSQGQHNDRATNMTADTKDDDITSLSIEDENLTEAPKDDDNDNSGIHLPVQLPDDVESSSGDDNDNIDSKDDDDDSSAHLRNFEKVNGFPEQGSNLCSSNQHISSEDGPINSSENDDIDHNTDDNKISTATDVRPEEAVEECEFDPVICSDEMGDDSPSDIKENKINSCDLIPQECSDERENILEKSQLESLGSS